MTGILLVDKEEGWTSSDVVAKLRGVLHEKRIGHAGTLDPLATGLLVVLTGRATRASDYVMAHSKKYRALLRLGVKTDTQDITGNIISESGDIPDEKEVREVLSHFSGDMEQIPPMYSAIKIRGKKLYEIARRGGEVERTPRHISISEISVAGHENNDYLIDISCSSGTYIRTVCNDIGDLLGCGGCMAALRRTQIGHVSVSEAHRISEIQTAVDEDRLGEYLLPADSPFSEFPAFFADEEAERKIRCGNTPSVQAKDGFCRVYSAGGEFLAFGRVSEGILLTEKSFFEV